MAASWSWLLPLAGIAAITSYLFFIYVGFAAEALGGEVTTQVMLLTVGLPALAFFSAAAAGLCAAWSLPASLCRLSFTARVPAWLLGSISAMAGAVAAAVVFYAALVAAGWVV